MRVWDLPPQELCDRHLMGEHAEIHAIWSVIRSEKRGYALHPEVMRWRGNLAALAARHDGVARELGARGFRHRSSLDCPADLPPPGPVSLLDTLEQQRVLLHAKPCRCFSSTKAGKMDVPANRDADEGA